MLKRGRRYVELLVGFDHALLVSNREKGTASNGVMEVSVNESRKGMPAYDLRLCGRQVYMQAV